MKSTWESKAFKARVRRHLAVGWVRTRNSPPGIDYCGWCTAVGSRRKHQPRLTPLFFRSITVSSSIRHLTDQLATAAALPRGVSSAARCTRSLFSHTRLIRPPGLLLARHGVILALEGPQSSLARGPEAVTVILTSRLSRATLPPPPRSKRRSRSCPPRSPTRKPVLTSDAPAPAAQRSSGRSTSRLPTSSTPSSCSSSSATGTWVSMSGPVWQADRWCKLCPARSHDAPQTPRADLVSSLQIASTPPWR